MNKEFESTVKLCFKWTDWDKNDLMHAASGMVEEAAEVLGPIKKMWVYGAPMDLDKIMEEMGDVEVYAEALRTLLGVSREEILTNVIKKLSKRYPHGYTDQAAQERADKV